MNRNYKIIQLHLAWGSESDNSTGHAYVVGRLAATSNRIDEDSIKPFTSYEEYLKTCKMQGIYSVNEERFNEYFNPQE